MFEGRYHRISMGRPEFDKSPNMKMVGLMIRLKRELWSTGKAVILDRGFYVLKLFL